MKINEAKLLKKGDFITYNNTKYKVLHIKELRHAHTNEPYIDIKCSKGNETMWVNNKLVELYQDKPISQNEVSEI